VNFDFVAASYRWLETIVFGDQLQQARVAFLGKIERPHRVLVVGEGNGRFLAEFVRRYPETSIDCIEGSARMIALARRVVGRAQVRFIEADLGAVGLGNNSYDLIVTHFVLDCFSEETLPLLIRKLADAATAEAVWLIADFCYPAGGWRRWWARALIAFMYFFFRVVAGIEARQLVDYRPMLRGQGFECTDEMTLPNEMIRSEFWRRR
jgi:ubiquinone/menaquinone biosynthesis C-methylase UbiE